MAAIHIIAGNKVVMEVRGMKWTKSVQIENDLAIARGKSALFSANFSASHWDYIS